MRSNDEHDVFDEWMRGPFWWDENEVVPAPDWRELFQGASEREILHNLIEGDPLQAFPYSWEFISANALLVEPQRLFLRVVSRIAVQASRYKGTPDLADLLSDVQEQSIKELMAEDLDAEQRGLGIDPQNLPGFRALIPKETSIEDNSTRRATVVFNNLDEPHRVPFYHVMVEGLSVEEFAEEFHQPIESVVQSISKTTQAIVRGCIAPHDKGDPLAFDPKELL